jgi:hypothetical protein
MSELQNLETTAVVISGLVAVVVSESLANRCPDLYFRSQLVTILVGAKQPWHRVLVVGASSRDTALRSRTNKRGDYLHNSARYPGPL